MRKTVTINLTIPAGWYMLVSWGLLQLSMWLPKQGGGIGWEWGPDHK